MDQDNTNQTKPTLDDAYKEREAHIKKVEAEHPDAGSMPEWAWKAPVKLSFDLENSLTPEKKAEFDAAFKKISESNFDPTATKNAFEEARKCLAGHDDIIKQYDAALGSFSSFNEEDAEFHRRMSARNNKQKST